MEHITDDLVRTLTALARAETPMELARWRRELRRSPNACDALAPLVDAVTERARRSFDLERLATQDPLTGLANRRSFSEALGRELARRRRDAGPSVVLLDLDGLKEINDRFGHAAGDEAIRMVARACLRAVRGGDLVARLGGDEFAVLLPDTNLEGAVVVAERIRAAVESTQVRGRRLRVSLGVAEAGPGDDDGPAMLQVADERMYADKHRRRLHVHLAA